MLKFVYSQRCSKLFRRKYLFDNLKCSRYNTISYDETFVKEASSLFDYIFTQLRHRVGKIDRCLITKTVFSMFLKHYDCYKQAKGICEQHQKEKFIFLLAVNYAFIL